MFKKALWPLACLFMMMLLLLPAAAGANAIDRLYVWDASLGEMTDDVPIYAVQWYARGSMRYLFLPTGMDANNLRVMLMGKAQTFSCNGVTVENGGVTDVFQPGGTYTINNGQDAYQVRVMQSANVASVHLSTQSGGIANISKSKSVLEPGTFFLLTQEGRAAYDKDFEYIRVRGNYSFYPNKKSYHVKLESGFSMLGMGKSKTWLLLANYKDQSLIRNAVTLDMAAAAGLAYTSQYRFVDLYMNNNYVGSYMLTEKIQVGENRVNIVDLEEATEKLNDQPLEKYTAKGVTTYQRGTSKYRVLDKIPIDITGGYLMQLELSDRYKESESGFVTDEGQTVQLKSPEYASKKQTAYISALVQSFENAISAPDGIDPDTGKHYTQIADLDSLARKYLVEEISKNLDANKSSFFIYKDADAVSELMYFGPVWDYDNAYANYTGSYYKKTLLDPTGLFAAADDYEKYYWFPKCYQHADFQAYAAAAYRQDFLPALEVLLGLRAQSDNTGNVMALSDYESLLSASAAMNFTRWRIFNADEFPVKTGADYHENIEYLRAFITGRMAYLNGIWGAEQAQ